MDALHLFAASVVLARRGVPVHEYEPVLVSLSHHHQALGGTLEAIRDPAGRAYLPFLLFSKSLGFRLTLTKKGVSGFLRSPKETWRWDEQTGWVFRGHKRVGQKKVLLLKYDGKTYVEASTFAKLTGITLEYDWSRLEISVDGPIRLASTTTNAKAAMPSRPPAPFDYRLISLPTVEAQVVATAAQSGGRTDVSRGAAAVATGDFLYMASQYQLALDSRGKPHPTWSLEREFPHASVRLGETALQGVPGLIDPRIGTGIALKISGDRPNLQGPFRVKTQPHSLVELFRGSALVGSTTSQEDGWAEFPSDEILPGYQELLAVTTSEDGVVTRQTVKKYGANEPPSVSLNVARQTQSLGLGPFPSQSEQSMRLETPWGDRSAFQFDLLHRDRAWSGRVGASTWINSYQLGLGALSTRDVSLGIAASNFRFETLFGPGSASLTRPSTSLRWSPPVSRGFMDIAFERWAWRESSQVSVFAGGFLGRTSLAGQISLGLENSPERASGWMMVSRRLSQGSLRFESNFSVGKSNVVGSAGVTLTRHFSRDDFGSAAMFVGRQGPELRGSYARLLGPLAIQATLGWGLKRSFLSLGLTTSVSLDGGESGFQPLSARQFARLDVRVFMDENQNGVCDRGEPLVEGVPVRVQGLAQISTTNSKGIATVRNVMSGQPLMVAIEEASLPEPDLCAANSGTSIALRPGSRRRVDLGLVRTFEIEGALRGLDHPQGRMVQLLNGEKLVGESCLSDDGTFVFSCVRPGEYRLSLLGDEPPQKVMSVRVKNEDLKVLLEVK